MTIESPWGRIETSLRLRGRHNALNALAAAAACLALGIEPPSIAEGLTAMSPVAGSLEFRQGAGGAIIINDAYNANTSSLAAALETLTELPGERILVLGDMAELGDEADVWHRWAGQAAHAAGIRGLFAISKLAHLAAESFGEAACHLPDGQSLAEALRPHLRPSVTILVKGSRCMEMENIVGALLGTKDALLYR
ncbi:MAG: glutamate ligase domain-containing protein [Candidatus Methylumidiphilus sp.]